MKFTSTKSQLLKAATFAASGINGRATLAVLNHLLLTADFNLTLTGTNLDLTTAATSDADVTEPGSVCVPASLFVDTIKNAPAEIEAELVDGRILIRSGRSKAKLAFIAAEEFPAQKAVTGTEITIPGDVLRRGLDQVRKVASTDESRHVLNGTCFEFKNGCLTLVATDGKRMSIATFDAVGQDASYIVPTPVAERLSAAIDRGTEPVACTFADNQVQFATSTWTVRGRLVDGRYPNWRQLITTPEITVEVGSAALRSIIQRASVYTTEKAASINLLFGRNTLTVKSGNGDNTFEDSIDAKSDCDVALGLNPHYLIDAMAGVGDTARIGLVDELSPVQFVDGSFKSLVMPMRMS